MRTMPPAEAADDDAPTGVFVRSSANLWDAQDVARYLKVSRSWVYQRAEAGLLPCVRVGGLLRFRPDSVRAIVNESAPRPKRAAGAPVTPKNR
ncbi:MAG TPA: helix-turn-helix domain-containing protein [Polyangia bacterium]|nr:helix-turn-helix domain-containing protein [Polyangia bacterium]